MKVAILTNFQDFNPGYSLTGIVNDQVTMLQKYEHEVSLFVCEQYNHQHDYNLPGRSEESPLPIRKEVPFGHLTDYRRSTEISESSKVYSAKIEDFLKTTLKEFDIIFTHDWVFTGWNLPFALAIQKASPYLDKARWLHWVHSIPSQGFDWWDVKRYGPRHKIVFPNKTERTRVAESFRGHIKDVTVIPHIKDLRTWFDFHPDTINFIDRYPEIMSADIVKVYPASTDRLTAKRVDKVMMILGAIKKRGFSVFLCVANQWATGKQRKEDITQYRGIARKNGLDPDKDFVFTSEVAEKYATGITTRMLRELMLCANLFIFPTREESFGLVGPEAALSGAKMMVLNKSLSMMTEVHGMTGLYVDFGSHHMQHKVDDEKKYYHDIALLILGRMKECDGINAQTWHRKHHNYDYLYTRYYEPVMAESKIWTI